MDHLEFVRLLQATDKERQTTETLSYGYEYKLRNSLMEDLLKNGGVTLKDHSYLELLIDNVDTFRADYNGYKSYADPEYGWGSYAEGKSVIVMLTTLDGERSYWKLSGYLDSWDNGFSDEWTFSQVEPVDWRG